jgi:hypothetical protein
VRLRYLSAGAPGAPEGHSPLPLALHIRHMWHCCVLAGPARARRPDGRLSPLAWLSHGTVSALGTAAMPAAGSRGKPGADGRVKERPMDPDGHRRWSPPAARKAVSLRTRRRLLRIMSIVFGISVCAMFVGAASRVAGFLAGVSRVLRLEQDTRYSQYISEPQAPLSVALDAVPWKEVSSASGAPADAWIAYNGFSHLICPGLLAAVVVPSEHIVPRAQEAAVVLYSSDDSAPSHSESITTVNLTLAGNALHSHAMNECRAVIRSLGLHRTSL